MEENRASFQPNVFDADAGLHPGPYLVGNPSTTQQIKEIADGVLVAAMRRCAKIVEDPASSNSEVLNATKFLIELTRGKGAQDLKVTTDEDDLGRQIIAAVQGSRSPRHSRRDSD